MFCTFLNLAESSSGVSIFPLNIPVLSWVLYVLTVLPLDKLGELEELVPLVGEVVVEPPLASAFNLLNTGFQMRFVSSNLLFALSMIASSVSLSVLE